MELPSNPRRISLPLSLLRSLSKPQCMRVWLREKVGECCGVLLPEMVGAVAGAPPVSWGCDDEED
ncbi:hypothetical protein Hanom_Chr15g01406781 [Helianthus anomalus]